MKNITFVMLLFAIAFKINAEPSKPYAGQELRGITALSPSKMTGLLAGKGLGYAKVAELNGYPGPAHVLELADELQLSKQQRVKTQAIFNQMQTQAISLGEQVVAAEQELESIFENESASEVDIQKRLQQMGALEGQLRAVHINAHIQQKALLTEAQITDYNKLRGYTISDHKKDHSHHSH